MASKVFRVTGSFRVKHHDQAFSKEYVAATAAAAKETALSTIGSKHGVPRRLIQITDAKEVPAEQVQDAVVRHAAGMKA